MRYGRNSRRGRLTRKVQKVKSREAPQENEETAKELENRKGEEEKQAGGVNWDPNNSKGRRTGRRWQGATSENNNFPFLENGWPRV